MYLVAKSLQFDEAEFVNLSMSNLQVKKNDKLVI